MVIAERRWHERKRVSNTRLYQVHIPNLLSLPTSQHNPFLFSSNYKSLLLSLSLYSHFTTHQSPLSLSQTQNLSMAQKAQKNDTEFKVPEPIINPCTTTTTTTTSISEPSRFFDATTPATSSRSPKRSLPLDEESQTDQTTSSEPKRAVNRCSGCRRRVGLTGFRCRCGDLFCAEHRYSDRHDCSYDYKAAGREAIARENPVVKAAKIVKV